MVWIVASKTKGAMSCKVFSALSRWAKHWWGTAPWRTKLGDTNRPIQWVITLSTWGPTISIQDTADCKTTLVLVRHQCWHQRLYAEMSSMCLEEQTSQRVTAASWHPRGSLEEGGNGILWFQRHVIHPYLWLLKQVPFILPMQDFVGVLKELLNGSVCDWNFSRWHSLGQLGSFQHPRLCLIILYPQH